jgi:hypothetical protein
VDTKPNIPSDSGPPVESATTIVSKETSTVRSDGKLSQRESEVFGISVRAWLATLIVLTVCVLSLMEKAIVEPLYGAMYMSLGFYFGSQSSKSKTLNSL